MLTVKQICERFPYVSESSRLSLDRTTGAAPLPAWREGQKGQNHRE